MAKDRGLVEVPEITEADLTAYLIHETRGSESCSSTVTGKSSWHEDGRVFGKVVQHSAGKDYPVIIAGLNLAEEGLLKFLTYHPLQYKNEVALIGLGTAESFFLTQEGWVPRYGGVYTLETIYRKDLPKGLDLERCPEREELERLLSHEALLKMKDVAYSNGRTCHLSFKMGAGAGR